MHSRACAALGAIAHYAKSIAQSPALIEPDGLTLGYKELWAQIEALGHRLKEAGIGPGETVAVLLPQGARQVLAVAGVLNHCVCVPLQPRTTVAEVESSLRKLSVSALIVSSESEAEAEAARTMGLTVLVARNGVSPEDWQVRCPASPPQARSASSETILLLITSATTGNSKLVPLSAANLDAGIAARRDSLRLTASDRLLLMTSLCHIIGIENALAQFLVGGAVIATGGFDPTAYLRWLHHLKPTWYDCAPAVHQAALAQLKRESPGNPVSLRFVQSAGAPLPNDARQELEQVLRVPVFNDYGMTEACPIAIDAFLPGGRVPNSAGRSCGLEIGVMGPSGTLLPSDEEGEIVVRGPAVFSGYADDPEANRTAFRDGWFRTGDAGRLDQKGNLFVTGRLKEMINRGGEKILPSEVDAALASHPAVLEAAAFAVPHPTLGEDVACAVVLHATTSNEPPVSALELRRFVAQRLASFKVPHRIHFVDQIPRGELGKPQRWLLAERWRGNQAAPPSPAAVTEQLATAGMVFYKLHEIWGRILDRDNLGFDEDFFDAGGDSLAAINMLLEVDERLGCQTSAAAASFLDEPTLAHLADLVGKAEVPRPSQRTAGDIRVFVVREGSSSQRLFCVPPDEEEGLCFRRLATHLYGQMDLSIVRPANTFHSQALFGMEHAGAATATLLRQTQPEGPYFVGGYCYGGVVAVEAARQLLLEGHDVRLILFDVPMPGHPSLFRGWRIWLERARRGWHKFRIGNYREVADDLRRLARRLAWFAMVPIRRFFVPVEHVQAVKRFLDWAQFDYFPCYQARPVDAPILHFLCTDEPHMIQGLSRFGWRAIARRGIDERFVPFDHCNILHESNLPRIVDTIRQWIGTAQPWQKRLVCRTAGKDSRGAKSRHGSLGPK